MIPTSSNLSGFEACRALRPILRLSLVLEWLKRSICVGRFFQAVEVIDMACAMAIGTAVAMNRRRSERSITIF